MKPSLWLPGLVIGVAALAFGWVYWATPSPKPSREAAAPVVASITQPGYIGAAACQKCHAEYSQSFAGHGMARTFGPVTPADVQANFDQPPPVQHEATGFWYQPLRRGDEFFVEEIYLDEAGQKVHSLTKPVQYFMGSGHHTRSFFYRHGDRLYQLPVEWYGGEKSWDLAPGYEAGGDTRVFRQGFAGCLNCHTEHPTHRPGAEDDFVDPLPASMSCERCHGPGEKHSHTSLTQDVLNPSHLPAMRQVDICNQCHLEGKQLVLREGRGMYSYRPGEPLHQWRMAFLASQPEEDGFSFVSQGERMLYSKCYQHSSGKMTCTTCHDPHHSSKDRPVSYWKNGCLQCHAQGDCTEETARREARQDDCAGCHMRKSEPYDTRHITITDHWIRKRVGPWKKTEKTRLQLGEEVTELRPYTDLTGETPTGPDAPALLGLAHWQARQPHLARPILEQALVQSPGLIDARRALAALYLESNMLAAGRAEYLELLRQRPLFPFALAGLTRASVMASSGTHTEEIVKLLDKWYKVAPGDPQAMEEAARVLLFRNQADAARRLFRKAALTAPDRFRAELQLGDLYAAMDDWAEALTHYEAARQIRPFHSAAYDGLRECLQKLGNEARLKEVEHAAAVMTRSPLGKAAAAARPRS